MSKVTHLNSSMITPAGQRAISELSNSINAAIHDALEEGVPLDLALTVIETAVFETRWDIASATAEYE